MKRLQKILNGIGVFLALLVVFILLCNANPNISRSLGAWISAHVASRSDVSGNDISADNPITGAMSTAQTAASADTVSDAVSAAVSSEAILPQASQGTLQPENSPDGLTIQNGQSGYVAPSDSSLNIPSDVAGKNGYVPVSGNGQIVDAAAQSRQRPGTGETGEGLSFDETMYPYYGMLDTDLKKLYCQIYANANAVNQTFAPVAETTPGGLKNAFTAVSNDHPELFWMNTAYSYTYQANGSIAAISLQFNATASQLAQSRSLFEQNAQTLLTAAQNAGSVYEKEKAIHDAVVQKVAYNTGADLSQSAYSSIVNGSTVCAGYAKAFQYLMQKLGVPCYYCTGYAGENHAWNIISLEDGFYNVDTTWDDTDPSTYRYFNGADEDFSADHVRRDLAVNLPPCNGQTYRLLLADQSTGTQSLEEAGFTQENVLSSLEAYDADCLQQLESAQTNPVTFRSVIRDEILLQTIRASYQDNSYRDAYGSKILSEKGAAGMRTQISVEALKDGYYLLSHTFTFQ